MKFFYKKVNRGFTLIELLIVIAVIGVLAAVVLVAIDPLEQLDRTRDSGRKSSVSQLGHAVQAYTTASVTNRPPILTDVAADGTVLAAANWQTFMKGTGEIKTLIKSNPRVATNTCTAPVGGSKESDYCYSLQAAIGEFKVWVILESKSEKTRGACSGATPVAAGVYNSTFGKAGIVCLALVADTPGDAIEPK